jgi:hypothetical protein
MAPDDISYELAAHRVVSARIFDEIALCEDDPATLVKLVTAWRAVASAIAVLARTHAFLTGATQSLDEAIEESLKHVDFYLPDTD